MGELLLYYKRPDPTTWVYLSSFLTLGLFFVFHRVWSVRNLDLLLLILLGPGVLMIHQGYRQALAESEAKRASPVLVASMADEGASATSADVDASTTPPPVSGPRDQPKVGEPVAGDQDVGDQVVGDQVVGDLADSGDSAGSVPADPDQGGPQNREARGTDDSLHRDGQGKGTQDTGPGGAAGLIEGLDTEAVPPVRTVDSEVRTVGEETADVQRTGFLYLFAIELLLLVRLITDPLMVRRPKLDPNLTTGGLTFIGISLFIFMMANVVTSNAQTQLSQGPTLGPGYSLMNMLPAIPTRPTEEMALSDLRGPLPGDSDEQTRLTGVAKILAILAHLAIVSGMVLIANKHFGNLKAGMGCATLYLLLPYTAQMTGRVDHALPAAMLLWAILCYRRPMVAGLFLGLAAGLVYYPLFLLPLWISFYWQRGVRQFLVGVVAMLAVLMLLLALDGSNTLVGHLQQMFGIMNPMRSVADLRGFWALGWNPIWRLPVIVAFVILSVFFAIWPAQKNLGTLISASAAIMVSAQFWHGYGGGLYIAWFLPLLLLAVFRPNLQDRVAMKVVRSHAPRSVAAVEA